jgi:hypothetical protein
MYARTFASCCSNLTNGTEVLIFYTSSLAVAGARFTLTKLVPVWFEKSAVGTLAMQIESITSFTVATISESKSAALIVSMRESST